jgi:hypothetical protein
MAFLLRRTVIAAAALTVCCSCEKHPLGEMPEVQREQVDPAKKAWDRTSETGSKESSSSPTPAEFFPASTPR